MQIVNKIKMSNNNRNKGRSSNGPVTNLIRIFVLLLVFSFWLPELRIGTQGFVYPPPSIGGTGYRVGLPWVYEIIIVIISTLFLFGILTKEISLRITWFVRITFWMGAIAFLVLPLSRFLDLSAGAAAFGHIRVTLESLTLFLIVSHIDWTEKIVKYVLMLFIGAGVFNATIAITTFFLPGSIPFFTNIISQGTYLQVAGLFSQPSRQSLLLSMAFVLVLTSFMINQSSKFSFFKIVAYFALTIILSFGIAFAQTRTSYISIPLTLFLIYWIERKYFRVQMGYIFLTCFFLLSIIVIWEFTDILPVAMNRLIYIEFREQFMETRGLVWPISLNILFNYPLGIGYDTIGNITEPEVGIYITHAHNLFLHWGLMFGIPGLALLIYFLFRVYKNTGKLSAKTIPMIELNYLIRMKSGITLFLLSGMTEPFFITNSGIYFWLFAAIICSYLRREYGYAWSYTKYDQVRPSIGNH